MKGEKQETKVRAGKEKLAKYYDIVEIVAIAVVSVLLLFTFVGRLSTVEGSSMNSTLTDGDRLIISNLFYEPQDGDIVVFQQSGKYFNEPLVKRVIATAGQKIKIDFEKWAVYVDGVLLYENYITYESGRKMREDDYNKMYAAYFDEDGYMTVPEGYIFVMGDNRNHSSDSRFSGVGLVSVSDVMGHVLFRLFPNFGKVG